MVKVNTEMASINLDVSRQLNTGLGVLELIVPDSTEADNWRVLKVITKGFDRVSFEEGDRGQSHSVRYDIADLDGDLETHLRTAQCSIRHQGTIYEINRVPLVPSNQAQVYEITCAVRTMKNRHFKI